MSAGASPPPRPLGRVVVGLVLVALCVLAVEARKKFVRSFFAVGAGGPPPRLPDPGDAPPLAPASEVRVVLLDGLGADHADTLPTLRALCERGRALTVDVGFPTVSLPVQAVLWTGLTQQQSGLAFIGRAIEPPPGSLPSRVPGSVAVAESHRFIAGSFGFAEVAPATEDEADDSWQRGGGFLEAARQAVASPAPLVFVHVLRIDDTGHRHGARSAAYARAAREADALLAELWQAGGGRGRWFVLSDHGHRPAGHHGGPEPAIRQVRACVLGDGVDAADHRGTPVHLVDLSRELAAALDRPPHAEAAGRPLAAALAAPAPGATLPRAGTGRTLAALGLLGLGLAGAWLGARRWWALPLWLPIAYAALVLVEGVPTMSMPLVYRPLGREIYLGALPGLCVLAVVAGLLCRRLPPGRATLALLSPPLACVGAALVLCAGRPPLMPTWTAHASVALTVLAASSLVVGLAVLASAVRRGSGRATPAGRSGRAP